MPKGYWIARVDITDEDAYNAYRAANPAAFEKYGAKFPVRGGSFEVMEGEARGRNIVIEFESYEKALECYRSPEYQKAKSYRDGATIDDLIIIQGHDG